MWRDETLCYARYRSDLYGGCERASVLKTRIAIAIMAAAALVSVMYLSSTALDEICAAQVSDSATQQQVAQEQPVKSTPKAQWAKGVMPYLYQIDPEWSDIPYADDTIKTSGCGPTCLSMIYVYLTGKTDKNPAKMCKFSQKRGYVIDGMTSWEIMSEGASRLGIESEVLPADEDMVKSSLRKGRPVIASVGPGTFTTCGHFIVLCGVDDDGRAIIRDPNSLERSNETWDLSEIMPQFRNIWSFSLD